MANYKNITKQEMLDDFSTVMEVALEWHDEHSCLFDLDEAVNIAKKYGFKLDVSCLDLDKANYNLNPETIRYLKGMKG